MIGQGAGDDDDGWAANGLGNLPQLVQLGVNFRKVSPLEGYELNRVDGQRLNAMVIKQGFQIGEGVVG